jgi:hypothetical protein
MVLGVVSQRFIDVCTYFYFSLFFPHSTPSLLSVIPLWNQSSKAFISRVTGVEKLIHNFHISATVSDKT